MLQVGFGQARAELLPLDVNIDGRTTIGNEAAYLISISSQTRSFIWQD
jgi:hypothetical protein